MLCCCLRVIQYLAQHERILRRFASEFSDSQQIVVVNNNGFFLRVQPIFTIWRHQLRNNVNEMHATEIIRMSSTGRTYGCPSLVGVKNPPRTGRMYRRKNDTRIYVWSVHTVGPYGPDVRVVCLNAHYYSNNNNNLSNADDPVMRT